MGTDLSYPLMPSCKTERISATSYALGIPGGHEVYTLVFPASAADDLDLFDGILNDGSAFAMWTGGAADMDDVELQDDASYPSAPPPAAGPYAAPYGGAAASGGAVATSEPQPYGQPQPYGATPYGASGGAATSGQAMYAGAGGNDQVLYPQQQQQQQQGVMGKVKGKAVAAGAAVKTGAQTAATKTKQAAQTGKEKAVHAGQQARANVDEQRERTRENMRNRENKERRADRFYGEDETRMKRDIIESDTCGLDPCMRTFFFAFMATISIIITVVSVNSIPDTDEGDEKDDYGLFIALYSIGWMLEIGATAFIMRLDWQLRYHKNPIRGWAVGLYALTLVLIYVFGIVASYIGAILCLIIQIFAYIWYAFSFLPCARQCCNSLA